VWEDWLSTVNSPQGFVLTPHQPSTGAVLGAMKINYQLPITVIIGPEGGLSADEEQAALNKSFMPLCLGNRIMRTETASIAVLAILQHLYGDFA